MKLAHSFGDVGGGDGVSNVVLGEGVGVKELLEATVFEGSEESGTDLLSC